MVELALLSPTEPYFSRKSWYKSYKFSYEACSYNEGTEVKKYTHKNNKIVYQIHKIALIIHKIDTIFFLNLKQQINVIGSFNIKTWMNLNLIFAMFRHCFFLTASTPILSQIALSQKKHCHQLSRPLRLQT